MAPDPAGGPATRASGVSALRAGVAGALALALLRAGWLGWRTWSPPREPAVSIARTNDKLATAPRLSSAAVICNKSVSYTQDAPPQVIVWTKCDEWENRMIRLIGLWLVGCALCVTPVACALCVTPVAADEDVYDGPGGHQAANRDAAAAALRPA